MSLVVRREVDGVVTVWRDGRRLALRVEPEDRTDDEILAVLTQYEAAHGPVPFEEPTLADVMATAIADAFIGRGWDEEADG